MTTIFIVGKPFENQIKYIKSLGYTIGLFSDKNIDNSEFLTQFDQIIELDFSKENFTDDIPQDLKIDGVISRYENYILAKSQIASKFDLFAPSIEAAEAVSDKFIMRSKFLEFDRTITPQFKQISNIDEALDFAKEVGFPVITKPTNLAKSLLINISRNEEELRDNMQNTLDNIDSIYKKYNFYRESHIIIEEFLEGSKHSIEMYANKNGDIHAVEDVIDLIMAFEIGIDDGFNFSRQLPSKLPNEVQKEIKKVGIQGMKALGLTSTPGHIEIIVTDKGPKIIEIGGRIGGYRSQMHMIGNEIDLDAVEIKLALGEEFDLKSKAHKFVSVVEIFPENAGVFKSIDFSKFEDPNIIFSTRVKVGEKVGKAKDGFKFVAKAIITADNQEQLDMYINQMKDVEVELN